jgi:hypothetical protein
MTDCDHPTEEISHVDGDGIVRAGETLYMWAECECGTPTIVEATIEDIEMDSEGTTQHLKEYAGE